MFYCNYSDLLQDAGVKINFDIPQGKAKSAKHFVQMVVERGNLSLLFDALVNHPTALKTFDKNVVFDKDTLSTSSRKLLKVAKKAFNYGSEKGLLSEISINNYLDILDSNNNLLESQEKSSSQQKSSSQHFFSFLKPEITQEPFSELLGFEVDGVGSSYFVGARSAEDVVNEAWRFDHANKSADKTPKKDAIGDLIFSILKHPKAPQNPDLLRVAELAIKLADERGVKIHGEYKALLSNFQKHQSIKRNFNEMTENTSASKNSVKEPRKEDFVWPVAPVKPDVSGQKDLSFQSFQNLYHDLPQSIRDLTLKLLPCPENGPVSWSGLGNVGNTCWMNTIVQNFSHTSAFDPILLQDIDWNDKKMLAKNGCHPDTRYLLAILRVLINLQRDPTISVDAPTRRNLLERLANFFQEAQFVGKAREAQDAPEILAKLLSAISNGPHHMLLQKDVKNYTGGNKLSVNQDGTFLPLTVFKKTSIQDLVQETLSPLPASENQRASHWRVLLDGQEQHLFTDDPDLAQIEASKLMGIGANVEVKEAFLTSTQRQIKQLPDYLPLQITRPDKNIGLEVSQELAVYNPLDDRTQFYELDGAMICSGAHYYYFKKVKDSWVELNDSTVKAGLSFKDIHSTIDKHATAIFYKKVKN